MSNHEQYMARCIELASKGAGRVAPNPMVGAVLVHKDRIIGEGYHQQYGGSHAEVHCFNAVAEADEELVSESVIYVSLEPCAHFGKTPPCADLIVRKGVRKVVIGCRDPFEAVNGKGVERLRNAGIEVVEGVLEKECLELNKRFFTFHQKKRPYIILKWAQTADGKMAAASTERLLISNAYANTLVHRWRSEEAAILVGTNTALLDDPLLNNRLWTGPSPLRMVIDVNLRLPASLKLFTDGHPVVVYTAAQAVQEGEITYQKIAADRPLLPQILNYCYQQGIQSILVEGGAQLLQSLINEGWYDEIRVITNTSLQIGAGLAAPVATADSLYKEEQFLDNRIQYYYRNQ
ncbi:MAG TPA: bifunctional diaminohydroxyphosphoribosylaminopyrimidine deaminase/5-amino-6-(5-phosphoribosylamino)uracil reductase RibD [Sediminibacterium sp.]|nr:bifunctional diaminohydroxyphosphoribosylaminopyrimidine deaminase/5-amino-6-(5-phosphoribosylamino)uracil reductase RibD [Sediminibacterium sp.]